MNRWKCARAGRNFAAVAGTLTVLVSGIPAAQAAPRPQPGPRSLSVSVPAEAASLRPGATGTVPIRVVNSGSTPIAVRITRRGVRFGDEGRVAIAGRDPMWDGRVDLPASPITISAQSYRNVGVTVHMPARISPDLYFIGFLVTPLPNAAANLTYVNEIGSYITIDVPGPRTRTLAADFQLPRFALTSHVHAKVQIHNVGKAAAMYWGENDTTATPGSSAPSQARLDRSLLPAGRSRTIVVDAKPSFLIAIVTMHVHILYPGRTDAGTTEIVLTKHVLVVQPGAVVVLGAVLFVAGIWYVHRRRKRRKQRPTSPSPHRPVEPARNASRKRRSRTRRQRVPAHADAAARVDHLLAQARANPKPRKSSK
ncbi:MAG: hypothetical protein QOG50_2856 [Actinomycetota bacterium]|nr:hypothetical protein [Actinomycetota bacterium]